MRLKARHRRRIHACLTCLWLGPGLAVSVMLLDSVAWVVGMSWYAIVVSHLAAWSAETPVEQED